ncbi:ANTAR domain-containing protein [Streptomyces sp. NPDC047082]|uniref:ANTAR domain-containing protein n=1 Tax=Streptomyces sp. NPDC047082 TaxID=3155259 RepID=UPI0033F25EA5
MSEPKPPRHRHCRSSIMLRTCCRGAAPCRPPDAQEDALSREEDLRTEVVQLRRAMQTRPVIDQATGVLMASFSLSSEDAWYVLVMVSQNTNTKLHRLAQELVDTTQGGELSEAVQQQVAAAVAALHAAGDTPSS